MAEQAMVIDPRDSVAVAVVELIAGRSCTVKVGDDLQTVEIRGRIPFGHKFALRRVSAGESVLKYGEVIGEATARTLKKLGKHPNVAAVLVLGLGCERLTGSVIDGAMTLRQAGEEVFREVLAVANGKLTKAEILGHDELMAVWRPWPEHERVYGCGEWG